MLYEVITGGSAHGVTAEGLEWTLENETLLMGASRGISNVLLGQAATIQVNDGILLCFVFDPTEKR